MFQKSVWLAGVLIACCAVTSVSAQTAAPAPASKKMSVERLKEMQAKWSQNKSKLSACRKQVKSKGLAGDDRWFYIEECMGKT